MVINCMEVFLCVKIVEIAKEIGVVKKKRDALNAVNMNVEKSADSNAVIHLARITITEFGL